LNVHTKQFIVSLILIAGRFTLGFLGRYNILIGYPSGPMMVVGFFYALYTWTKLQKDHAFL
jgi:hypothetical protein